MLLVLIIYNEDYYFDQMYLLQKKYLEIMQKKYDFKFYFIIYKPIENNDIKFIVEEDNNLLIMNGNETYIPGILRKTILAMDILTKNLKLQYDFLLRTNISTFINYEKVFAYINSMIFDSSLFYYIGGFMTMTWEKVYIGTEYCGGAFILMNKQVILNITKNQEKIDYSIIDDFSIGEYLSRVDKSLLKKIDIREKLIFGDWQFKLIKDNNYYDYLAITNNYCKDDRQKDVDRLKFLIDNYFILVS